MVGEERARSGGAARYNPVGEEAGKEDNTMAARTTVWATYTKESDGVWGGEMGEPEVRGRGRGMDIGGSGRRGG